MRVDKTKQVPNPAVMENEWELRPLHTAWRTLYYSRRNVCTCYL